MTTNQFSKGTVSLPSLTTVQLPEFVSVALRVPQDQFGGGLENCEAWWYASGFTIRT